MGIPILIMFNHLDMYVNVILIILLLICKTECTFRVSRTPATWDVAEKQCQNFGGRLATLEDFDEFRTSAGDREAELGLDPGSEMWVAGKLGTGEWKWEGETSMPFDDEGSGYVNQGCHHQQQWNSGSKLPDISPRSCLEHCHWAGLVGLKKDYCMCEAELVNISMVEVGVCHISCEGSAMEMCGGLYGVSVYKPAPKLVVWGPGEPRAGQNCVVLKKKGAPGSGSGTGQLELVTADCHMQTRALCSFRNDEKCGLFHTCLRWTTGQFTRDTAAGSCQSLGGHLAEVDNSRQEYFKDLRKLPPGNFWLALRRRGQWSWTNGAPISMLDFFGDERDMSPDRACAVVQNVNDNVGLGARACTDLKYYLCQYGMMGEITGPVPGAQKSGTTGLPGLTLPPSFSNVTSVVGTTQSGDNGADTDDDDEEKDDDTSGTSSMLTTCMYSFLGFISGMVVVLIMGMIVYCIFRCKAPDPSKHQPLQEKRPHHHHHRPHDNSSSVSYSSRDGSVHIASPPPSDVTYDSVYDQGESPFRRTQRLIRAGSANSWVRHPQQGPKQRHGTDTMDSGLPDYTWRGLIGGKMEVINTQLRHHQDLAQSQPPGTRHVGGTYELHHHNNQGVHPHQNFTLGAESICTQGANRLSAECEVHCVDADRGYGSQPRSSAPGDITADLDALEGYYSLPNTSSTYPKRASSGSVTEQRSSRTLQGAENPMFLQLESKTDDQSNEENIYATIKKTFQRIQQEMKQEQEQANNERNSQAAPNTN